VRSRRPWAKALFGIAVSAGLLGYLLWGVDLRQMGDHLARTHWGHLGLSSALALFAVWVRAVRWGYLFPPGGRPSHLFSATMIGYMANNVLPLRAGEIVRAYVVTRRGAESVWTSLATLVVERLLDALSLVLVLAGLILAISVPRELQWAALGFLAIDLAAMGALVAVAVAPARGRALIARFAGRWPAIERKLAHVFETFVRGLVGVWTPRHGLPILVLSVLLWVVYALAVWIGLRAAQLPLPLTAAWAVLAFVALGVSLPSAPGFVGVFQVATVLALALFEVPRAEALSFSLIFHASQFVPITLAGWVFLIVEQVSLLQVTRDGVPEPEERRA
jgi:uncharacterized protein (TIRG00374 family)